MLPTIASVAATLLEVESRACAERQPDGEREREGQTLSRTDVTAFLKILLEVESRACADRQPDRVQIDRQTDRETDRWKEREREREGGWGRDRH